MAITLRFYATGDNLVSIPAGYCVGYSTACKIVIETGKALYAVLAPEFLKVPNTEEWKNIARDFSRIWNFPNCVGAIDGKHIAMQAPKHSGSEYYNYKQIHSTILMAACDANYKFTLIDLGAYGKEGDKHVYSKSFIAKNLEDGTFGLPPCTSLPYSNKCLPHVFVGDDAFPLKPYLLKPYPGRCTGSLEKIKRIFNYRYVFY